MVKEAWFRRYRPEERPASFDQIVQSWDTANKPSELADYSVCTTWGVKGPHFYLLTSCARSSTFPTSKFAMALSRWPKKTSRPCSARNLRAPNRRAQ